MQKLNHTSKRRAVTVQVDEALHACHHTDAPAQLVAAELPAAAGHACVVGMGERATADAGLGRCVHVQVRERRLMAQVGRERSLQAARLEVQVGERERQKAEPLPVVETRNKMR